MRERMGEASVRLCKEIGYENCGTIEYLVDNDGKNFYFMEMNTRIQVEHPITEEVYGCDLIKEQIQIAAGWEAQPPCAQRHPARPRHRVPHQRRGSLPQLHPQPRPHRPVVSAPVVAACASTPTFTPATKCLPTMTR